MKRICKDCECEFSHKESDKGFFNQCDDCSQSDSTQKYLGYNDGSLNKSTNTSIYRGTDKKVRHKLSHQRNITN